MEKIDPVNLLIKSNQKNAIVYIDDKQKGSIDKYNSYDEWVSPGNYTIKLTKPMYVTATQKVVAKANAKNEFTIDMVRNSGHLYFDVNPEDATVKIGEQTFMKESYGEIELTPDYYEVEIFAKEYLSQIKKINVELGSKTDVKVDLVKNSGIIRFNITPTQAKIRIGKNAYDNTQALVRMELVPGNYDVEVFADGYISQKEAIELKLSGRLSKSYNLVKNSGIIDFKITPPDAEVRVGDEVFSGYTEFGSVELLPGTYEVEVFADGYIRQTETIELKLSEKISKSYSLVENVGFLQLKLTPPDATITIDEVDYTGQKRIKLPPGKHTLFASKRWYFSQSWDFSTTLQKSVEKSITLEKNSGILNISISPDDATFYLNNSQYEAGSMELEAKTYELKVEKDGWHPQTQMLTITKNGTLDKTINLVEIVGDLQLSVAPPTASLELKQDGQTLASWQGSKFVGSLPAGDYQLVAKAEEHKTYRADVQIVEGSVAKLDVQMVEGVDYALIFTINPKDAEVQLLKGGLQIDSWIGDKRIEKLPLGEYEVEAIATDFNQYKNGVIIKEGRVTKLDVKMERNPVEMVYVEGGTFQMGSTNGDSDEKPVHSVTLSSYKISKFEVTQKQWKEIMGNNPSNWSGDNLPVENVSWNDVQNFISKLNSKTGGNYRLPTEAEWEFAARGGTSSNGYTYSGSNSIGDVAWYSSNSGGKTHPVGTKSPNELGIYDMSGNVWEWCSDWYGSYSSSSQTNPQGPSSGSDRVYGGGGWADDSSGCRVANRGGSHPSIGGNSMGFRLVVQ